MSFSLSICCPILQFDSSTRLSIESFISFKESLQDYSDTCVTIVCVTSHASDLENDFLKNNVDTVFYSPPEGVYSAFNNCIRLSYQLSADWIWIIGSGDTIILPKQDISAFLFAVRHSSSPISMGMYIGDRLSRCRKLYSSPFKYNNLDKMRINHPATLVPARIYKQFGLYSTNHRVVSDYQFIHALFRSNVSITALNIYSVYHELGGISTSSYKFRLGEHIECLKVLFSIYGFSLEWNFALISRSLRYLVSFLKTRKL